MNVTEQISNEINMKNDVPNFGAGDTITVYYKIREGNKERVQFFKGEVIQRRGSGSTETFTIRKNIFWYWSRKDFSNQLTFN